MVGPSEDVRSKGWNAWGVPNISILLFQYFASRMAASYNHVNVSY